MLICEVLSLERKPKENIFSVFVQTIPLVEAEINQ